MSSRILSLLHRYRPAATLSCSGKSADNIFYQPASAYQKPMNHYQIWEDTPLKTLTGNTRGTKLNVRSC